MLEPVNHSLVRMPGRWRCHPSPSYGVAQRAASVQTENGPLACCRCTPPLPGAHFPPGWGDAATEVLQLAGHVGGSEYHQPEGWSRSQDMFKNTKQHISGNSSFMHIIQNDNSIRVQKRSRHHFPLQHIICAVSVPYKWKTVKSFREYSGLTA